MKKYPKKTIGELCNIIKGETGIASVTPGEYPLVVTAKERKTSATYQFDTQAVCIPLVSSSGHGKKSLNYVHYQEGKFALGTILAAIIPKNHYEIYAAFLHQYLFFYKDTKIVPLMRGAANVSLAVKDIAKIEVPLPPINQQKDFIIFFNKLQKFNQGLIREFDNQQLYISQLKQAILQEAISGQLTAEWRKQNPIQKGNPDTDAAALLAKIKAEKKQLIADGKLKKEKSLPEISPDEIPFSLPDSWVWCRLGEICDIKGGKRVPNGYKLKTTPTPYIYIRVSDMKNGTIDDSDLHYIDEEVYQGIKRYTISKDDIYMTIVGATIGKCGLVPEKFDGMNLTENAAKIILLIINKIFLWYCLDSSFCQAQFIDKTKQVAVQKMAINRFSSTLIPLPPLAEQKAIVEKVDYLTKIIDELEAQIQHRKQLAENLMQTVLREAFE
ncbi:restriction endonuclease subunit S [Kamptonema animale CS-326]|jgi:type I restriction enzyme S subunit|uniref:restriction endonuclease subunit S n=1 Tax=Kamptonema animale TaxID=92934 RepID=UPI00232DE2B6|nr:restriction endonuclease subunit S [Kamptonema animale]MDB9511894.1 restriction endonuclease subunit S [Kamptonema animale CS-326]